MFDLALPTNWVAFVVALVISQVLGFLWYSNMLFAKPWMKAIGKTEKQLQAEANPTVYAYSIVGAAVMLLVLSNVFRWAGITETTSAIGAAFLLWLGFVATASVLNTVFEGRSWSLWAIDNGYHLANVVIASIILTLL